MGHHARTLTALVAVLGATLVAASSVAAQPMLVRAETRDMNSIASGSFINRMAVDAQPVTIHDLAGVHADATCPANSAIAAIAAAVGPAGYLTQYDATSGKWLLSSLKNVGPTGGITPPTQPKWTWRVYIDQSPIDHNGGWEAGDVCAPSDYDSTGAEVLAYQACGTQNFGCFSGRPLYMRIREGGPYDLAPQTVPGHGAPVVVKVIGEPEGTGGSPGGPVAGLFGTDEPGFAPTSALATGPYAGTALVSFSTSGPHQVIAVANNGSRPPARLPVCVSEGNDGFCGSTKYQAPPEIPYAPSPCTTNGHDGFCGTPDTSGPITHVSNILNKQVFKTKKGPGQVKGTIDTDPNGVGTVKLRLTRVTTSRVLIKPKKKTKAKKKAKKRYKTVKRCTAWSDDKALLVTAKCGTKYGTWFTADLSDLRNEFNYSFALTLPKGSYTLEVTATDEDKHVDVPTKGRNVLSFTVK